MILTVADIHEALGTIGGWGSCIIPEYTWGDMRIDAAIIDVRKRWIRGFEIKMTRSDYLADEKWMNYVQFCSSLTLVCPSGLIQKEEVQKPFGLLWVKRNDWRGFDLNWVRRPKRFQTRDGLAWLFTYLRVMEKELPRLDTELKRVKAELKWKTQEGSKG